MKKGALLLRVSTEQQEFESQKNELIPIAEGLGYKISDDLIFGQFITGKDDYRGRERESITALKEACRSGKVDAIFIWEVSRLSRSSIAGRMFINEFNEMKIPIYFKDRNIWTLDPETLEEDNTTKMIIGLFFDFAEAELKTMRNRMMRGKRRNASDGLATGGYLNYGYEKELETGKIQICEEEAIFVKDLFQKYSTGQYSLGDLVRYANSTPNLPRYKKNSKRGEFTTNTGRLKSISTVHWNKAVIRGMLKNLIYIGKSHFQDITKSVPAIVDKNLFDQVQERLAKNPKTKEKSRKHTHLLQKLMICGFCNNMFYGHYSYKGNHYICSSFNTTHLNCGNSSLGYEKVESIIWDFVKKHTYIFNKIEEKEKEEFKKELMTQKEELIKDRNRTEQEINKQAKAIDNLLDMVANGVFTMQDIQRKKKSIDQDIEKYNNDLAKIESSLTLIEIKLNKIDNQLLTEDDILELEQSRQKMKDIINLAIENIKVYRINRSNVVLQIALVNKVVNILYMYRARKHFRYYYIDDDVATFLPHNEIPEFVKHKIVDVCFEVTSNNNSVFGEEIFGNYSYSQMCEILERYNQYEDYKPFEKMIVYTKKDKSIENVI